MSMSSTISLAHRRDKSQLYLPALGLDGTHSSRYHPAPSRNETAIVQPVLVRFLLHTRVVPHLLINYAGKAHRL